MRESERAVHGIGGHLCVINGFPKLTCNKPAKVPSHANVVRFDYSGGGREGGGRGGGQRRCARVPAAEHRLRRWGATAVRRNVLDHFASAVAAGGPGGAAEQQQRRRQRCRLGVGGATFGADASEQQHVPQQQPSAAAGFRNL